MFRWITRNRDNDPPLSEADRRDLQLSEYLDGDLSAEERSALETTLATDPQLTDALDGMRHVRDSLASLDPVRAPRSFAIEAPPLPARAGFGRFELVARFGAVAAAVAFAAVLVGDLSGSTPTPITTTSDSLAAGAGAERSAAISAPAESDQGAPLIESASGGAGDAEAVAPAADDGSTQTGGAIDDAPARLAPTSSALTGAITPTPAPSEGTASVQAASAPTTEAAAGDGGVFTTSDSPNALPAGPATNNDTAAEEPGDGSASPDSTVESLPNRALDGGVGGSTGTNSESTTLATQVTGSSDQAQAQPLVPAGEAAAPFEADKGGITTLATILGAATVILASASALLWWRRRNSTAGPV